MVATRGDAERLQRWVRLAPVLIAIAATLAVMGSLSPLQGGPGVTCDEIYDLSCGKRMVWGLERYGTALLTRTRIEEVFAAQTKHPPLGRWMIGLAHSTFDSTPESIEALSILPARFAPALGFGLTVALVGWFAGREFGSLAGWSSALALVLMPRVFAEAHFASLDTWTMLTCTAATFALCWAVERDARWPRVAWAGFVWGLALLTKIQGLMLVVPLGLWLAWRLRARAAYAGPLWIGVGVAVFFAGWPWLWLDPIANLREYLGTATQRLALHCFYAGRVWNDVNVPWHYPWAMTAATVPVGLLVLAGYGSWSRRRELLGIGSAQLVVGCLLYWLLLFSVPGVPVYDGVRLFLPAFPLLAICAGWGCAAAWQWAELRWPRQSRQRIAVAAVFWVTQAIGLVAFHPFQLSYYNLLVGGLRGAERLGFEVTYWGDTIDGALVAEAGKHARAASSDCLIFAPNLAPYQTVGILLTYPEFQDDALCLEGWDADWPEAIRTYRTLLVYNRRADLAAVEPLLVGATVVAENRRQGVWLARVYELPPRERAEHNQSQ